MRQCFWYVKLISISMIPFITSLALGSGGVGGGVVSAIGNIPILGGAVSSLLSNPIGTIGNIGSAIGSLFSSNAGAVQLADKRTGSPDMQGVIFFLHDVNQQTGGIWLAGEDCPWMGSDWNDNISGVSVAPGFDVEIYENINYGGNKWKLSELRTDWKNYTGNQPHTDMWGGKWWNDRASSFKVIKMRSNAVSFAQAEAQQISQISVSKSPVLSDPPPRPYDTTAGATYQEVFGSGILPTDTTTTTTTEPEKKGSMMWLLFVALAVFGFKDKIKKML